MKTNENYQCQTKIKISFMGLQQRKPPFPSGLNSQPFLPGPLPANKQDNASGTDRGFSFSRAALRGKNLSRSRSSAESGNSQSRNILSHITCSQRFFFSQGSPNFPPSRTFSIFFKKLEETSQGYLHFKLV